jgi:hypothetical protein
VADVLPVFIFSFHEKVLPVFPFCMLSGNGLSHRPNLKARAIFIGNLKGAEHFSA